MFKRYLIAGLLVWIPLAITFWVLDLIVTTMDQTLLLLPTSWRPDALLPFHIPGLGLLLSLLIVLRPAYSPPTSLASVCCAGGTVC